MLIDLALPFVQAPRWWRLSFADYFCLFGKSLQKSLSSHSALKTVADRAGVVQEEKLKGWIAERRLDRVQICEMETEYETNCREYRNPGRMRLTPKQDTKPFVLFVATLPARMTVQMVEEDHHKEMSDCQGGP